MKRDLPFYSDRTTGEMQTCRRWSPRARLFRRRYARLRRDVYVLPLLVAAIGFAAYVWNEHQWRQTTAADQVEIATLRSQVESLRGVVSGPKTVCRIGSSGRESCIKIIYPQGGA